MLFCENICSKCSFLPHNIYGHITTIKVIRKYVNAAVKDELLYKYFRKLLHIMYLIAFLFFYTLPVLSVYLYRFYFMKFNN